MTQSVLDKAKQHFAEQIGGELLKTHIKEWNTDIYYKTISSMRTESKIMALTQQGKTAEALVESIVLKSFDQNGQRLFREADRVTLLNEADPKVLVALATTLNNASDMSMEAIEKNL
jgi:hypothetical protein